MRFPKSQFFQAYVQVLKPELEVSVCSVSWQGSSALAVTGESWDLKNAGLVLWTAGSSSGASAVCCARSELDRCLFFGSF